MFHYVLVGQPDFEWPENCEGFFRSELLDEDRRDHFLPFMANPTFEVEENPIENEPQTLSHVSEMPIEEQNYFNYAIVRKKSVEKSRRSSSTKSTAYPSVTCVVSETSDLSLSEMLANDQAIAEKNHLDEIIAEISSPSFANRTDVSIQEIRMDEIIEAVCKSPLETVEHVSASKKREVCFNAEVDETRPDKTSSPANAEISECQILAETGSGYPNIYYLQYTGPDETSDDDVIVAPSKASRKVRDKIVKKKKQMSESDLPSASGLQYNFVKDKLMVTCLKYKVIRSDKSNKVCKWQK